MAKVTITENILENIATAIRTKAGTEDLMRPSEMPAAINAIETGGYPEPTGTINITQNGTENVKDYAAANVNVPNSYSASDEGKVVDDGTLVAQTSQNITQNGTYDTTKKNEVVVNVSGGGGGDYPLISAYYDEEMSGYGLLLSHEIEPIVPASSYIQSALNNGFNTMVKDDGTRVTTGMTQQIELLESYANMQPSAFESLHLFSAKGMEYIGYIYGTQIITDLDLVLLGDFSQGGSATGNVLADSIENYSGVILQGIYNKTRTSIYNTSVLYQDITLSQQYWAGMKDRNNSYRCFVTFTDNTHVDLGGNKQVIIYGIL